MYVCIYQSEGFPLTGYFIPGRVGLGSAPFPELLLSVGFRPELIEGGGVTPQKNMKSKQPQR